MYHHVKKLMYTVTVGDADPKLGKMLLPGFIKRNLRRSEISK
jgi:Mn-containing catalase